MTEMEVTDDVGIEKTRLAMSWQQLKLGGGHMGTLCFSLFIYIFSKYFTVKGFINLTPGPKEWGGRKVEGDSTSKAPTACLVLA